ADLEELASETRFKFESEFDAHPILRLSKINDLCARNLEKSIFLKKLMEIKHSLTLVNLICENSFYREICEELATKRATNKAGQVDLL
ncbi:ATP-dependent helicase, partial [Campylobacter jejuni]|nr:ATP-dependent helicase [Campylobacter jejuni]